MAVEEPAPKRSRVPKTLLLTPETVRAHHTWLDTPKFYQAEVLDLRIRSLPHSMLEPLRKHCRPKVVHLHEMPQAGNVYWHEISRICFAEVEECHLYSDGLPGMAWETFMPNLRRLVVDTVTASDHFFWTVYLNSTPCPLLTEVVLHGAFYKGFFELVLQEVSTVRTVCYPDLPDLPCLRHADGWPAYLATLNPALLVKLEPRLLSLVQRHKAAQINAIADVLPVVGVPELIAGMAFDWHENQSEFEFAADVDG